MARLLSFLFLGLAPVHAPAPALAQEPPPVDRPTEAEPICLERIYPDVVQVPRERRGQVHVVPATARSASMLEKKGFKKVECSAGGLAERASLEAWRDEMCELASFGNAAVQTQLERALGERPAVFCALGEQLSGPWDRRQPAKIRTTR